MTNLLGFRMARMAVFDKVRHHGCSNYAPAPRYLLGVNRVDLAAFAVCPVIGPFQTWRFALEDVSPDVIQAPTMVIKVFKIWVSVP
jgi:hypothetical protein